MCPHPIMGPCQVTPGPAPLPKAQWTHQETPDSERSNWRELCLQFHTPMLAAQIKAQSISLIGLGSLSSLLYQQQRFDYLNL